MDQVAQIIGYACIGSCILGIVFLVLLALPQSRLRYYTLKTFSVVLFAITGLLGLYILSPLDLLPDLIPIAGQVDDAGALIAALIAGISAFISSRSAGSADVYDVQSEPQGRKALPSGKHR